MASTKSIGKRIGKKLKGTIDSALSDSKLSQSAMTAAQTAASTAKHGLDQMLLGLQHRGLTEIKDSEDLVQRIGRNVLTRAESIRSQIASTPFSPAWLKEVSLVPDTKSPEVEEVGDVIAEAIRDETPLDQVEMDLAIGEDAITAEGAGSMTEASVSDPAEDMLPDAVHDAPKSKRASSSRAKGSRPKATKSAGAKSKTSRSSHATK